MLHGFNTNVMRLFVEKVSQKARYSSWILKDFRGPEFTPILDSVHSPSDLKHLDVKQLKQLAHELRWETINSVSKVGGHLGSSLGERIECGFLVMKCIERRCAHDVSGSYIGRLFFIQSWMITCVEKYESKPLNSISLTPRRFQVWWS